MSHRRTCGWGVSFSNSLWSVTVLTDRGNSWFIWGQVVGRIVNTHFSLVQVTYNLLDEPLFQLLLGPHMLPVSRYQMRGTGLVRPLRIQM